MDLKNFILKEMKQIHLPNYYGSKQQIKNEIKIMEESGIEMKYNEAIEDYYYRVYHKQPNANKNLK
tara:strand:- start:389 stop:586 length:198 start_codon:yes stop_codon:yes gene_type:complete